MSRLLPFAFLCSLVLLTSSLAQPTAEPYLLIRGAFVVAGKQPDGDSVRFIPDQPALLKGLKRSSRIAPSRDGSVQLRFEGVDAPELHYENLRQPFSAEPRDALLEQLGFTGVTYTSGGIVARSSTPARVRGAILSVAAEVYGRPISFVYREADISGKDGSRLTLTDDLVRASVNAWSLEAGLVYPTFYSSLPAESRLGLRGIAVRARVAGRGVWALDRSADFALSKLENLTREQLVLPKLFRRAVVYFQDTGKGFRGTLGDWFAANPSRDDAVRVGERRTTLSKLLEVRGTRVRLLADVLDLVFEEQ